MQNLLSIESNFLNLPQVKSALNLQEIRSVQRTITNAKKKKFEQTLTLSKLVINAVDWFSSEDGKRACAEEGITWSNEEIGQKVFGWQKSFFYKVVKAGKLQAEVIDTFKTKCDEAEANGDEPNRSLEGLLKFAKQVETGTQAGGQEDGENAEGGESDSEAAQVEIRHENVLTFKCKVDGLNVSVKVDAEGNLTTNNTREQIEEAIALLTIQLHNL
jgi:hypothetical protein